MAIFLNREGIIKHFERLFEEAKGEIVMVVPYIKLTSEIISKLKEAENRRVEVLIIYRENKLDKNEKERLTAFKNITLLHHPNVHAKCYLNDDSIIICSMNLYDHSIKNNREMGVLLDLFSYEDVEGDLFESWGDDERAIENAIEEIQVIKNASTVEKKSDYVSKRGFEFHTLKTRRDHLEDFLQRVNSISDNKRFVIEEVDRNGPSIVCRNFHENLDVVLDLDLLTSKTSKRKLSIRRITILMKHSDSALKKIKSIFDINLEYKFKYYKTYWPRDNAIMIYRDQYGFPDVWNRGSEIDHIKGLFKGCFLVINELKNINDFSRIK